MSSVKSVNLQKLKKALTDLGFNQKDSPRGHALFEHSNTGAVVSIPTIKDDVPAIFVNTAARQVANSGIASVEKFERALQDKPRKGAYKSERRGSRGP